MSHVLHFGYIPGLLLKIPDFLLQLSHIMSLSLQLLFFLNHLRQSGHQLLILLNKSPVIIPQLVHFLMRPQNLNLKLLLQLMQRPQLLFDTLGLFSQHLNTVLHLPNGNLQDFILLIVCRRLVPDVFDLHEAELLGLLLSHPQLPDLLSEEARRVLLLPLDVLDGLLLLGDDPQGCLVVDLELVHLLLLVAVQDFQLFELLV